jgi:hypothetical protein
MNETDLMLQQYQQELAMAKQLQESGKVNPYAPAMFPNEQRQNLIEQELNFKDELESIERLLRCDIIKKDKDGNEYWAPNPDPSKVFFNELGVNDFIRNLVTIINKHKILANYSLEQVNERVRQIKHEIRILIYNNYEMYGMDNDYKYNNYSMIVIAIGSVVEDAYTRALNGEGHKGVSQQRLVTQNESINPQVSPLIMQQKKGVMSKLAPWNWGSGR